MKTAIATLLASTFIASSALACGMKSADTKTMTTAKIEQPAQDAMSTFDPAADPVFDVEAEAAAEEEKAD